MQKPAGQNNRVLFYTLSSCLRFACRTLGLLATAAQTTPANDELNSSIRGGALNYRTGKLDDGTDPYGWYDRD